jgi:hypothetical protein
MFCIDMEVSIDLPYFGYNFAGQENPVFRILMFRGPFQTQIDPRFFVR